MPWYRKCSSRGPQLSDQMCLNADTTPGRRERPPLWRDARDRIEPDRPLHVRYVEIAHVVDASAGYRVEDVERQVAVRVNYSNPLSPIDVIHRQIEKEGTLTAA